MSWKIGLASLVPVFALGTAIAVRIDLFDVPAVNHATAALAGVVPQKNDAPSQKCSTNIDPKSGLDVYNATCK